MNAAINPADKIIWMHCASLGEFEQGRPLLEKLRLGYPEHKLLLTFYSPSGYEVQKSYPGADYIFYLPMDGASNSKRFLEITKPVLAIFVKYEFWYYYLKKISYRNIPLILVSAIFREDMPFFRWYGSLQRSMLQRFDHIFVQNQASLTLLSTLGISNKVTVSGDTRFDRVADIAEKFEPITHIQEFIGESKALVAGSTWKEDDDILHQALTLLHDPQLKLIIAPHDIDETRIQFIIGLFPGAIRFSELTQSGIASATSNTLVIDNIGMLSRLYKYGHITFVGGAFNKGGVHNVLEAAVYGKPVIYGPEFKEYLEAVELVHEGGAITVKDEEECRRAIQRLLTDADEYALRCRSSLEYVRSHRGATGKIMSYIEKKLSKS